MPAWGRDFPEHARGPPAKVDRRPRRPGASRGGEAFYHEQVSQLFKTLAWSGNE